MEKILIVEDEAAISQVLAAYLKKENFIPVQCFRGDEAELMIEQESPDLVILDVMLPGKSGWDILGTIREKNLAPVIMLTALGNVPERLKGLNRGADDYIAKPFIAAEVVARVKAVLRRAKQRHPVQRYGCLEIDQLAHVVKVNDRKLDLTPRDLALLLFLAKHPNQTFTRDQLIDHVWGWDYDGSDRAVDLSIKRIRKGLVDWPVKEGEIKTLRGLGYQFHVQ